MRNSITSLESKHEIVQLTQEALKLANAAVHFDKNQNIIGACDYYDKCILNLDEVLNKLAPNSDEWKTLAAIRSKYDDRMEFLRENEGGKFGLSSLVKSDSKASTKRTPKKRILFSDEVYSEEIEEQTKPMEEAPEHLSEIPYWQLRNIKKTIQTGGFLTSGIFVPQQIWAQTGVKFSGLTAKTTAFEIIIKLIDVNVDVLYPSADEDSLLLSEKNFAIVEEELFGLQNQLSKPFPFIKEVTNPNSLTHSGSSANIAGMSNAASAEDLSANSSHSTATASSAGVSKDNKASSNRSFATMVSTLGKNMKKYAEVSYQRLVVALPSKMTGEDMAEYTALICKLCDKCQALDTWFRFILGLKKQWSSEVSEGAAPLTLVEGTAVTTRASFVCMQQVDKLLDSLQNISAYIRGIVCEILLRDLEILITRFLAKTRKSFSRMYWDDDVEYAD